MLQGLLGFSKLFPPVSLYYTGITILPVWETRPPKAQVEKKFATSCVTSILWIYKFMARNSFGCLILGLFTIPWLVVG